MKFPDDFLWGAATSAYQIEGSPLADGAGPSNWHSFSQTPGTIANGDTGDPACDHYRRFPEDIELMRQMGLKAYRFSIAWNRVLPEGRGQLNPKGLDFYRRLVDTLNNRGIIPFTTLHHWDMPLKLADQGGWTHRDSAAWFADYAQQMFRVFGKEIYHWATLNEPWVITHEGYVAGTHPPARKSLTEAAIAAHNLLRGHALAVRAFRTESQGKIGLVVNLEPKQPATESSEDLAAAALAHAYMNRQFLDPVLLGSYPEELIELHGSNRWKYPETDLQLIQEPIDWLGINYYSRSIISHDPLAPPFFSRRVRNPGAEYTAMDWEVFPEGLQQCLKWVQRRYGDIPLYITENGAAFTDPQPRQGQIHDPLRLAYLKSHLRAAAAAISDGVKLEGYFVWSLLDNFEWAYGYDKRFGLIHVDRVNQTRTFKDSGHYYRQVIEKNGDIPEEF